MNGAEREVCAIGKGRIEGKEIEGKEEKVIEVWKADLPRYLNQCPSPKSCGWLTATEPIRYNVKGQRAGRASISFWKQSERGQLYIASGRVSLPFLFCLVSLCKSLTDWMSTICAKTFHVL